MIFFYSLYVHNMIYEISTYLGELFSNFPLDNLKLLQSAMKTRVPVCIYYESYEHF